MKDITSVAMAHDILRDVWNTTAEPHLRDTLNGIKDQFDALAETNVTDTVVQNILREQSEKEYDEYDERDVTEMLAEIVRQFSHAFSSEEDERAEDIIPRLIDQKDFIDQCGFVAANLTWTVFKKADIDKQQE